MNRLLYISIRWLSLHRKLSVEFLAPLVTMATIALVLSGLTACDSSNGKAISRNFVVTEQHACTSERANIKADRLRKYLDIICVDSVQYIAYEGAGHYALTVKFNKNGTVATCGE